jgi:hypothetical protein
VPWVCIKFRENIVTAEKSFLLKNNLDIGRQICEFMQVPRIVQKKR